MQKDTKLIFKNFGKNYKIKAHDRKDTQNSFIHAKHTRQTTFKKPTKHTKVMQSCLKTLKKHKSI